MKMVLRSLYLDPQLDTMLGFRADDDGITKAELMRRFLQAGLTRPSTADTAYIAAVEGTKNPKHSDAKSARPAEPKPAPKTAKPAKVVDLPRQRRVASNRR